MKEVIALKTLLFNWAFHADGMRNSFGSNKSVFTGR
jgi:hypothetical protein